MNADYLYSGSDVSGRDQLFTTRAPERKLEGVIARTVTAVVVSVAVWTGAPSPIVRHLGGTRAVKLDVSDSLLERVWKARSDGVQPNDKARRRATVVLGALRDAGMEPGRVVADGDGGVALYVFGPGERHARILAANEGEIIALCADYRTNRHDGWTSDLGDLDSTVDRIQQFLAS